MPDVLDGRRIVLGITGGIAAYKVLLLLRGLRTAGADVQPVLTPDAERFVPRLPHAERTRDGRGDEGGISERAQVNEPGAVRKRIEQIGCYL